ncbi:MAG: WbqC family protein [Desulfomonile tiedjei]|nr:WbqC family protein [Desulfomonile tiedjei]
MAENRVCVIMQPTYLPWLGYFDLIDQSTVFVFLDNVQFSKQSWQQRNRIRTDKGLEWLTVPVLTKGRRGQLIRDVEIRRSNSFPKDHVRCMEVNYARSPFFHKYFAGFEALLLRNCSTLGELNVGVIRWLASEIGIDARFEVATEIDAQGSRSELLANICEEVGANIYLSPVGSASYLTTEHGAFERKNIEVVFQNFDHPEYRQVFKPFMPYASCIDLLFNAGERSLEIIRSGRRPAITFSKMLEQVPHVTAIHQPETNQHG